MENRFKLNKKFILSVRSWSESQLFCVVACPADELLLLKSVCESVQDFLFYIKLYGSVICTQIWLASLARDSKEVYEWLN